jgi:hypothetical protein
METIYPREIKLENEELKSLIEEKGKLINEGRAKSEEIEVIEKELAEIDKNLQEEEKKVDLTEFKKKEASITKRMDKCIAEIQEHKNTVYAKIKAETPQEIRDKYEEVSKLKEEKETERNKIALSAQKYNDKIIPLSRELIKPLLQDEYEDYDSVFLKDGEINCTIFSHLDDFKNNFNKTKKV